MVNINDIRWGGSGIEKIVFDYICDLLPEGKHILELGSGYVSTFAFSTRYKVTSIEENEDYINTIENVKYIHAPIDESGWFDAQKVYDGLPMTYDLIFIDAPCGGGKRSGFLDNLALFDLTVPMIFHDTYRDTERLLCENVAKALRKKPIFFDNKGGDSWGVIL